MSMRSMSSRLTCLVPLAFLLACASCASKPPRSPQAAPALVLAPQPGWIVEPPANAMRKAQYSLPRAEGDSEDASLIVHSFGGQGGSREANLERWAGQFEQTDGSSSADKLESSTRTIAGLKVFVAELSGTYVAETAPGSGVHVNKPGWRMLAAIVDTREGPWYFKLVGPAATIAKWEASYETFLSELAPGN